tara:strand:+ start:1711 stop:1989 length:279 start_codon:yes stop_codon:yes gene_type:complete
MINSVSYRLFIRRIYKNCFIVRKYLIDHKNINDMSVGNPKNLRFAEGLQKIEKAVKNVEADLNNIALVHKDKNHRVKKELSFKTKNDKSKSA